MPNVDDMDLMQEYAARQSETAFAGLVNRHINLVYSVALRYVGNSETDGAWRQLAPHLEDAMTRLNEKDRTLLALRYFENKTGAETAALLGIQEWAVHKRTARAGKAATVLC